MNCIYCGKQLPEDSEFCVYCGNPIEKAQAPHCSKCGGSVPNDSGFCSYCGTPYENAHNKLDNPKIETSFATMEVGHQNASVHTKKKKATKKQVLLIILGAVFVLALLGLNVYYAFFSLSRGDLGLGLRVTVPVRYGQHISCHR